MTDESDVPTYDTDEPGQRKIVAWRVDAFERLGFKTFDAYAMAVRRDVDREDVANMLESGCTPELVKGIML